MLSIFSFMALIQCSSLQKAKENRVLSVTQKLNSLLQDSKMAPWLDFKLEDHRIWFYSEKEKRIQLYWQRVLTELNFDQNKIWLPTGNLAFTDALVDKQKVLIVKLDHKDFDQSTKDLNLILNEIFFKFYQELSPLWKKLELPPSQFAYFPSLERPRYYRFEMLQQMKSFLKTQKTSHLHAFAWWFYKWKKEFPEESHPFIDRKYGSAQYYASHLLYQINPSGKEQSLDFVQRYKDLTFKSKEYQSELFDLKEEARFLGFMSGLILNTLEKSSPIWKKQVNSGASSLDILARKFRPYPQKSDVQKLNQYIHINIKKMELLDPLNQLSSVVAELSSENSIRLVVDNSKLDFNNFEHKGIYKSFFNFNNTHNVSLTWLAAPFVLKGKKFSHHFAANDVWIRAIKTPCHEQKDSTIFLLTPEQLSEKEKTLVVEINSKFIPFNYTKKNINRTLWYCLVEI